MSNSNKAEDDLKAMIKNHELITLFSLIAMLITVVTHSCFRFFDSMRKWRCFCALKMSAEDWKLEIGDAAANQEK